MDPGTLSVDGISIKQHPSMVREAATVQVLAHEFFHRVFGMVDLYVNNCTTCPEKYSIMDNQKSLLPHLDPWGKLHLGFIKPRVVMEDGTYTLGDAETDRTLAEQTPYPEHSSSTIRGGRIRSMSISF